MYRTVSLKLLGLGRVHDVKIRLVRYCCNVIVLGVGTRVTVWDTVEAVGEAKNVFYVLFRRTPSVG